MPRTLKVLALLLTVILFNAQGVVAQEGPLKLIKLPPKFKIELFASEVPNARSLALSPSGVVYVGTRTAGNVYALVDQDNDHKADRVYTLASGLHMPNGVAIRNGALYVAEIQRILRFDDIEKDLAHPPTPAVVYDGFLNNTWHGWKVIHFGPDGKLYVPVGAPCNTCITDGKPYGGFVRMGPDGTDVETIAFGVRNSVGFDWDPRSKEMWFTDNGRDELGDDAPPDELNRLSSLGLHFGFPYCHGGDIPDPEFGKIKACSEFTPPAQKLQPHAAALGIRFYTGEMFPKEYQNKLFIAEHGSWNRSRKVGYRIMTVDVDNGNASNYQEFATGWKVGERAWGRPVDVLQMPDGSLLVSDDQAGAVYRISYQP